jgi:hypothetical protein
VCILIVLYAAAAQVLRALLIPSLTLMNGRVFFTRYDLCISKKEEKDIQVAHYCVMFPFLDMMMDFLVTGF